MLTSLFLCGALGVLVIPARSELISVCLEEDNDLRVDCRIEPKPNKINSYEFSWSSGTKESLINTNVSGSAAEAQFRDKSEVVELEPHGYRMTLKGFTETLPHNTTYMCKISGQVESVLVEKGRRVGYLCICGSTLGKQH
uniref:Thy-1 membrane glycoprotein-like n=1 Tax=Fundulus heteroclitus TaxID=8078 RepID=A0A3Q2PRF1_FUNHE